MARRRTLLFLPVLFLIATAVQGRAEQPTAAATYAFNSYIATVEARLAAQHRSENGFLATANSPAHVRQGELAIERIAPQPTAELPGAMLYDWRGTAFVPGAKAADFERIMRNFAGYPSYYAPEVTAARVLEQKGDNYRAAMRVRQHHVITVVMDTEYAIGFGRLDERHGYSASRSTRIAEIDAPGSTKERALSPGEEHGFLWRLNTYWSWEERDGGLYMQIESVSLTRSIPAGLGWAIGPFVESVPRESLEFTLRATSNALRR
jgi:hypothetical protein